PPVTTQEPDPSDQELWPASSHERLHGEVGQAIYSSDCERIQSGIRRAGGVTPVKQVRAFEEHGEQETRCKGENECFGSGQIRPALLVISPCKDAGKGDDNECHAPTPWARDIRLFPITLHTERAYPASLAEPFHLVVKPCGVGVFPSRGNMRVQLFFQLCGI